MHTRRAVRKDLPAIATVAANAMAKDELSLWMSPNQARYPEVHRQRCLRTAIRRWNSAAVMLVIETDDSDKEWTGSPQIIAYAAYEKEVGAPDDTSKLGVTLSGYIERFLYDIENNYYWYFSHNFNTDRARWKEVIKVVNSNTIYNSYQKYWQLDFLAVEPSFGRRGLGSQLIDWGQQRAAEDSVPLILWSSEQGEALYLRKGFKEMSKMTFGGAIQAPIMKWDPPSLTEDSA